MVYQPQYTEETVVDCYTLERDSVPDSRLSYPIIHQILYYNL